MNFPYLADCHFTPFFLCRRHQFSFSHCLYWESCKTLLGGLQASSYSCSVLVGSTYFHQCWQFVSAFARLLRGSFYKTRFCPRLSSLFQTQLLRYTVFTYSLWSCCSRYVRHILSIVLTLDSSWWVMNISISTLKASEEEQISSRHFFTLTKTSESFLMLSARPLQIL